MQEGENIGTVLTAVAVENGAGFGGNMEVELGTGLAAAAGEVPVGVDHVVTQVAHVAECQPAQAEHEAEHVERLRHRRGEPAGRIGKEQPAKFVGTEGPVARLLAGQVEIAARRKIIDTGPAAYGPECTQIETDRSRRGSMAMGEPAGEHFHPAGVDAGRQSGVGFMCIKDGFEYGTAVIGRRACVACLLAGISFGQQDADQRRVKVRTVHDAMCIDV